MRTLIGSLATIGVIVGSGVAAGAAELSPVYEKAPPPLAGYNWSGFYIGANVGWGFDQFTGTSFAPASGTTTNLSALQRDGVLGGGQIGYNWMLNPSWLFGLETDIDGADIHDSGVDCSDTGCSHHDQRADAFGTARARIGFVQNSWLIYATGGYAYDHSSNDRTIVFVTHPVDAVLVGQSSNASGWDSGWTAGGGVEWGFAPSWSIKAEYLFAQIDETRTYTYTGPVSNPAAGDRINSATDRYNIFRVGVNYRFWP
jgi:outer membrane immunogenic protein